MDPDEAVAAVSVPGSAGRVRLSDVARHVGVSIGTVSNVLNHPERVAPATQTTVLAAIRELGFVPNQSARVLTGAPSNVIALVVLDVMSPFFMEAADAVERLARERGHVVMLCNSQNDRAKEAELLHLLGGQRVRGVVLVPAAGDDPVADRIRGRLPVVLMDHEGVEDCCSVAVDDVSGADMAATHLLGLGHRRLAFVGGPRDLRQMSQRALGMRRALERAGFDPAAALTEVYVETGIGIRAGMEAAERLLSAGLPTGIVCGNDMLAFGVYRVLHRAGIAVPDDVALIGYDDIDVAADWIVPLTSVRQPTQEMGYRAAQLLLEDTGQPGHVHQHVQLQPELVVRNSCGALMVPNRHSAVAG